MDKDALARRNIIVGISEGTSFLVAVAFLQSDTVVSQFLNLATGSVALAGFAATLRSGMFFVGQFVLGMFIHRLRVQKKYLLLIDSIGRPLLLMTALVLLAGFRGKAAAWLFLLFYTLFFTFDGMGSLCLTEILTRTVPVRKRGFITGIQCSVSGVLCVGVGFVLRAILDGDWPQYTQYTVIFALAGLFMLLNIVCVALLRDVKHASRPEEPMFRLMPYLRQVLPLFNSDRQVRAVLIGRMLYLLSMIAAPINVLFGTSMGLLSASQASLLVYMPIAGQIVSGVVWARLCEKKGYPVVMLIAQCVGILTALCNFTAFFMARAGMGVMVPLCCAMFLISFNGTGYVGYYQHLICIAKEDQRPLYLVMSAIVLMPMSFGTTLAGVVAENFGYQYVYAITLTAAVLGFMLVWRNFIVPAKSS